jgi:hypothetical protein
MRAIRQTVLGFLSSHLGLHHFLIRVVVGQRRVNLGRGDMPDPTGNLRGGPFLLF